MGGRTECDHFMCVKAYLGGLVGACTAYICCYQSLSTCLVLLSDLQHSRACDGLQAEMRRARCEYAGSSWKALMRGQRSQLLCEVIALAKSGKS